MTTICQTDLKAHLLAFIDQEMECTGAEFGNLQLVNRDTGNLEIVAQRGFTNEWVDYWNLQAEGQGSCGSALASASQVVVENITKSKIFDDQKTLEVQLRAGVWACQSTPLYASSGAPIGMLNVHFGQPHHPTVATLRLLDSLAQQAASAISALIPVLH